jgi:hypothetical protein
MNHRTTPQLLDSAAQLVGVLYWVSHTTYYALSPDHPQVHVDPGWPPPTLPGRYAHLRADCSELGRALDALQNRGITL